MTRWFVSVGAWRDGKSSGRRGGRPKSRGRRRERFAPEVLEARSLLSTVAEFPTPLLGGAQAQPREIISLGGELWVLNAAGAIGRVNPSNPGANQLHATSLAGKLPQQIAAGPDGQLWVTQLQPGAIDVISPSSPDSVQTYTQGFATNRRPSGITAGPDGQGHQVLWFTDPFTNALGKIDPATGTIVELAGLPGSMVGFAGYQSQIVAGPDGKLYFTEYNTTAGAIGIYDPAAASNAYSQVALADGMQPFGIAVGPDGNIWFTEAKPKAAGAGVDNPAIGVLNLSAGAPTRTDHAVPTPSGGQTPYPYRIAAGPDGQLWFSDQTNGAIGSFNPVSQTFASLAIPQNNSSNSAPSPVGLTAGPDGNLWFADYSGAIGKVTLDTQLVVTAQPPANIDVNTPFGLAAAVQYTSTGAVKKAFGGDIALALANNPGGATLGGTLTVAAVNGVATFNGLTLNNPGTGYTIQASAGGLNPATTGGFNAVTPSAANHLVVTTQPPASVVSGAPFGLIVKAEDLGGGVDATYNGLVTLALANNPGGATLGGTLTVAAVNGVATFNGLTLDKAGAGYALTATSGTLASATTAAVAVTPASPAQLVVVPPAGDITAGAPFNLSVVVKDGNGNVVTNFNGDVTIALANNPGGGGLGGTTTVKAVNGVATFVGLVLNNPGAGYTFRAASGLLTAVSATTIDVKAAPVPPQLLAGTAGASPLFNQRRNRRGRPIGRPTFIGFKFTFNAPMDAGSVANPSNYKVGTYVQVTRRVGRKTVRSLQLKPVAFTISFSAATNSVSLILSGRQAFTRGGQVTLAASTLAGIKSQQGLLLDGNGSGKAGVDAVFNITPRAKAINHA